MEPFWLHFFLGAHCSLLAGSAKTCVVLGWVIYFEKQQGNKLPGSDFVSVDTLLTRVLERGQGASYIGI